MERLLSEKGLMVLKEARQEWDSSSCSLSYISLAQSAAWDFPLPLSIPGPLGSALAVCEKPGHRPCRWLQNTDTALAWGPKEGGQSQKGKGLGLESGCRTVCSLPSKQRLSPTKLSLRLSARKRGWFQVTLGQQRPQIPMPLHLLKGHFTHTPL